MAAEVEMKRVVLAALTAFGVGAAVTLGAQGQSAAHAPILVPGSSAEQPGERGVSAHTNHMIRVGREAVGASPSGETPASIAGAYQLGSLAATGLGTIVIVDAFDYPTALNDFNVFSTQFGLPTEPSANATAATNAHFQVVYAGGPKAPRAKCGWAQESALDIEWAHAMAPNAKIVLVLAKSNSFTDLFAAVDVANAIPGAQQVSMSWGGSEFSSEASYDFHFTHNGIVYFKTALPQSGTGAASRTIPSMPIPTPACRSTTARCARASAGGWCLAARASPLRRSRASCIAPAASA